MMFKLLGTSKIITDHVLQYLLPSPHYHRYRLIRIKHRHDYSRHNRIQKQHIKHPGVINTTKCKQ